MHLNRTTRRAWWVGLTWLVASFVAFAAAADDTPPHARPRGRRDAANQPMSSSPRPATVGPPVQRASAEVAAASVQAPSARSARQADFSSCKKIPAGKRVVRLTLKPETDLTSLVAWISSITCKSFLVPGTIPPEGKKVTVIAPGIMTPAEAYQLFLSSLDSVGLTVEPSGWFSRIIETTKAKSSSIPVYRGDAEGPAERLTGAR
jgi:hypothetical protein